MVSIIILTHNAPEYVNLVIQSLRKTKKTIEYEVIILDNGSEKETQQILVDAYLNGYIDKLILEHDNLFFAKGNNRASRIISEKSKYILFLNSDIEIKSEEWLEKILSIHVRGITSFGLGITPKGRIVPDGFCFLIDRDLYEKYPMNEKYEWWYGISYTIVPVLMRHKVVAVNNFEKYIHHFGGKSGDAWKKAKGMENDATYLDDIYRKCKKQVEVIYDLDREIGNKYPYINVFRGICEDKWCLKDIDFEIMVNEEGIIEIQGICPFEENRKKILNIVVNKKKTIYEIQGNRINLQVKKGIEKNRVNRVSIHCDFSYKAPDPDIRELCFVIDELKAR